MQQTFKMPAYGYSILDAHHHECASVSWRDWIENLINLFRMFLLKWSVKFKMTFDVKEHVLPKATKSIDYGLFFFINFNL